MNSKFFVGRIVRPQREDASGVDLIGGVRAGGVCGCAEHFAPERGCKLAAGGVVHGSLDLNQRPLTLVRHSHEIRSPLVVLDLRGSFDLRRR